MPQQPFALSRRPDRRRPSAGRAFTLIEIMVAMGIIVLLIALALPAFSFITGSRSGEAASNQISSALGIARAQAVGVQQTRGVAIYHDKDLDRSVIALVELREVGVPNFNAWVNAASAGTSQSYSLGEYRSYSGNYYVCTETHIDTDGSKEPGTGGGDIYWRRIDGPTGTVNTDYLQGTTTPVPVLEIVPTAEIANLPTGIDVRTVGNTFRYSVAMGPIKVYRYFSPAVVLFDANGQVISKTFRIFKDGVLGNRIDFASPPTTPDSKQTPVGPTQYRPYKSNSGIGLVVYDTNQFKNATQAFTIEQIEDWLDQNATPSMLNRYNGTLVKGD